MEQILVTAGVIIENGKLLIAQRLPQGSEGGKWEFPGGEVEPGEDPKVGLRRELREELGVTVEVGDVLEVVSRVASRHLILIYFRCYIKEGTPEPIECQQVRWLTPEEINELEKPESDRIFWEKWAEKIVDRR